VTTWRKELTDTLTAHGETWDDVEAHTLTKKELDTEFDPGWGGTDGAPFTLWTAKRVYFPACYDGSEWVASVPRHPNGQKTHHVGGG
jgi:hypothetical protein